MGELHAARKRGAKIRFIDPRRHESAAVGDVIQILPDTDVFLLASMIHVIDRDRGFSKDGLARGRRVAELRAFVALYPPERAAQLTGIDEQDIVQLAHDFADANSASVHMSTGVNMGRQGTLAYWLIHALSLVTGNLGSTGWQRALGRFLSERQGRPLRLR